eukprot:SAG11_NODE_37388_length_257_cov_0.651899_1_plen_44_part_01
MESKRHDHSSHRQIILFSDEGKRLSTWVNLSKGLHRFFFLFLAF